MHINALINVCLSYGAIFQNYKQSIFILRVHFAHVLPSQKVHGTFAFSYFCRHSKACFLSGDGRVNVMTRSQVCLPRGPAVECYL